MDNIKIPLTPEEITVLDRATSFLHDSYNSLFRGLMGIEGDMTILAAWKVNSDTMREVRNAVKDGAPYLTYDHLCDLAALKETLHEDAATLNHALIEECANAGKRVAGGAKGLRLESWKNCATIFSANYFKVRG